MSGSPYRLTPTYVAWLSTRTLWSVQPTPFHAAYCGNLPGGFQGTLANPAGTPIPTRHLNAKVGDQPGLPRPVRPSRTPARAA